MHPPVLLAALAALLALPPSAAAAQEEFRLCGLFSYSNAGDGVASFGTVFFDGAGAARVRLKINALAAAGGRTTREVITEGPYTFDAGAMGRMVFAFPDIGIPEAVYEFVAVDVEGDSPTELFSVLRSGGVNGQLVTPRLRRIRDCPQEGDGAAR